MQISWEVLQKKRVHIGGGEVGVGKTHSRGVARVHFK